MNQTFPNYLSSHGDLIQLILFISLFFISWNIENIYGVLFGYKKWKHALVNAPFIFTNIPGQLILGVLFVAVMKWTSQHHFGIIYYLHIGKHPVLVFIVIFFLLDLGEYVYHILMHRFKMLWRFHLVHHSDSIVDISTTLREHPGENIIRLSFTLVWIFFTGALFWTVFLRKAIQVFTTMFAHINYRLPDKIDNIIGLIFITPNLHQTHHHNKQPYTDSNYGDVLSIWDRLFGTLKKLNSEEVVFGIDSVVVIEDTMNFKSLVKTPFVQTEKRKINID